MQLVESDNLPAFSFAAASLWIYWGPLFTHDIRLIHQADQRCRNKL